MPKQSIIKKLESLAGTRKMVRLTRAFPGEQHCYGFILRISQTWILVHDHGDTQLYGYSLFRVADVTKARSGKYERFWDHMLQGEGLLDQVGVDCEIDLESTIQVLKSLKELGKYVIVECESRDDSEYDEFYIGQIVKVTRKHLWFVHFDAVGQWEDDGVKLPLDDITRIQFDTPYINIYSKHVPAIRPELHV